MPSDDDYFILDDGPVSGGYKIAKGVSTIHWCLTWDHCILFIQKRMKEEQSRPNVWRYGLDDEFFPVTIPS